MDNLNAIPFLKWAGGKRQLLTQFKELYPAKLKEGQINKYVEPFVGGGAVFFELQKKYNFKEVVLNDINQELIITYKIIQNHCDKLIEKLSLLEEQYLNLKDRSDMYYEIRDKFNEEKNIMDYTEYDEQWISHASNLIFLNRTCFNGLYRLNKKGKYNVPIGSYKNPTICNSKNLQDVSAALQGVKLVFGEYYNVHEYIDIDEKTFVYIDPPYRPLTTSSSFTSYSKSGFNDDNQKQLASWFKELVKKYNAQVMLSNSKQDDNFFHELYEKDENDIYITQVQAKRNINSNSANRGKIAEIVVRHK